MAAKLDTHDLYSDEAFDHLLEWLKRDRNALIAMARGRHVWGHYRYGDTRFFELDEYQLKAEASEEIADCINYIVRYLQLVSLDSFA